MTRFADFHPQTIFHPAVVCPRGRRSPRATHARTLGDCLVDLAEAVTTHHTLPETEVENFAACLADAKADDMNVQYHLVWQPDANRWQLTLQVSNDGQRYSVARAMLTVSFDQFCILERVLKLNRVPEVCNA